VNSRWALSRRFSRSRWGGCAEARPDPLPGYRPASPSERAAVVSVVSEYYAIRNHAAVTGDIAPLYGVHPSLVQERTASPV
jgi:hypothetical protein